MVRCRINGRHLVRACWQTRCHVRGQNPIHSGGVQPFEERKLEWLGRGRLGERGQGFDDDVRMTDDLAGFVQLLRRGKVILLSVNEEAGLHPLNGERDRERLVRGDGPKVLGERELCGGHVRGGRD